MMEVMKKVTVRKDCRRCYQQCKKEGFMKVTYSELARTPHSLNDAKVV
jgi:hypothetical protein